MTSPLWLIGSGPMAQAYASVLQSQGVFFRVIGRGIDSAKSFRNATGIDVYTGGLENALALLPAPEKAIVAVGVEQLVPTALNLLSADCQCVLLEKPGALKLSDLQRIQNIATHKNAKVFIAYNRRFYASVQKLRDLVVNDDGITSAVFEFTEWSHRLKDLQKASGVMEHWLLANSSHVIDLAFHFIGLPARGKWHAWHTGSLGWHPASSRFHGAGVSARGIPFSYHADWEAPGRWGIEFLTRSNRYVLRPMEKLYVVPLGSVEGKFINLDDSLDNQFKPGLFKQCYAFLSAHNNVCKSNVLCSLVDHLNAFPIYQRIAGYPQA